METFESLVKSGVSKEDALNAINYKRPCCRVTMSRPNILPYNDVIDREIVMGRKNIREAVIQTQEIDSLGPKAPLNEEDAVEARHLRDLRRENAAQRSEGDPIAALKRWEEQDLETRKAMALQGLDELEIEKRLTGVFSAESQSWESPYLNKKGRIAKLPGVPSFPLAPGEGELEIRDVGARYQVRVLKRRSFFAL